MTTMVEETAQRAFDDFGVSICFNERKVDEFAAILKSSESTKGTAEVAALNGVLRTALMLGYINLDLCAACRQYLSTELTTAYEKRQAITKINIIISEGFKKIYGFENAKKKSFWNTQIRTAIGFVGELEEEYKNIGTELETYSSDESKFNQDMRNLSVHYDEDPIKVYDMLASLSAEDVISRCVDFQHLLVKVAEFVCKLSDLMLVKSENKYNMKEMSFPNNKP